MLSIPPSYVAARLKEGTRLGKRLGRFKEDVDRPLAAILTLNHHRIALINGLEYMDFARRRREGSATVGCWM